MSGTWGGDSPLVPSFLIEHEERNGHLNLEWKASPEQQMAWRPNKAIGLNDGCVKLIRVISSQRSDSCSCSVSPPLGHLRQSQPKFDPWANPRQFVPPNHPMNIVSSTRTGWSWLILAGHCKLSGWVRIDSQRFFSTQCHSASYFDVPIAVVCCFSWWCFGINNCDIPRLTNMPRPGVEGQILPDRWVNAASPRECVVEACHPTFDHPSWTLKLQFWPANSAKWKWTCKL